MGPLVKFVDEEALPLSDKFRLFAFKCQFVGNVWSQESGFNLGLSFEACVGQGLIDVACNHVRDCVGQKLSDWSPKLWFPDMLAHAIAHVMKRLSKDKWDEDLRDLRVDLRLLKNAWKMWTWRSRRLTGGSRRLSWQQSQQPCSCSWSVAATRHHCLRLR